MANGINARALTLPDLIKNLVDRVRKLEKPNSIHIGGVGASIGANTGYTLSVNDSGQLVSTSDSGTVTVIGSP